MGAKVEHDIFNWGSFNDDLFRNEGFQTRLNNNSVFRFNLFLRGIIAPSIHSKIPWRRK